MATSTGPGGGEFGPYSLPPKLNDARDSIRRYAAVIEGLWRAEIPAREHPCWQDPRFHLQLVEAMRRPENYPEWLKFKVFKAVVRELVGR